MSRYANKRIDEFGGDYKGRFHMAELCIKKVKEACGRDYPVSFRISTEEYLDGGSTLDDAIIYSQLAQDAGADIINISVGSGMEILLPHLILIQDSMWRQRQGLKQK